MEGIAPDGSPVAVFAALPAGPVPEQVHTLAGEGASILDLGCGAGRYANPLVAMGHPVVGVDNSGEMLACLDARVEAVAADAFVLDLRRRFDCVLAASYLVNLWPEGLLATCRRHVARDGVVLVQRYEPGWAREAEAGESTVGPVTIRVGPIDCVDDSLHAVVTYTLDDGRRFTQAVDAQVLDDAVLADRAERAGLVVAGTLDEYGEWIVLERAPR